MGDLVTSEVFPSPPAMGSAEVAKPRKPSKTSPTQRSLKHLRDQGMTAAVVERWNQFVGIRQDLFGFIDIIALADGYVVAVQATSGDNVSSRIQKIQESEHLAAVRKAGIRILVHGWRKNAAGKWVLREVDIS